MKNSWTTSAPPHHSVPTSSIASAEARTSTGEGRTLDKEDAMLKRVELTDDQKRAVEKAFAKTDTMKNLVGDFKRSIKVMEIRGDDYIFWSAILNRTIKVPVSEVLEKGNQEMNEGMKISDLNLSVRAFNALKRAGVDSIGELLNRWPDGVKKIRNMGAKNFEEIGTRLLEAGLIESLEEGGTR